ncbi:ROK family protein [Puia dinghuensis]|uniref:Transcriptional regulator n=1 Tax=Puia dinghuensis TaxID=1792502 RepID=A0A8J2UHW1_9BACT|nr:ROK family protein [Puia dinghuensis]GGB19692.1 transcriptional regulator [Puia dinghuensis]
MMRVGVDVGGTHISAALVADDVVLSETYRRAAIDPAADAMTLLAAFAGLMNAVMGAAASPVEGIGLAMPGPFDYSTGLSLIKGLNKYENFYGLNIKEALRSWGKALRRGGEPLPICFGNDAACFGLGEARSGQATGHEKIIAITLGTGFGACFVQGKTLVTTGDGVPANGYLYCIPFKDGIAEDYLSTRWLLAAYPAADVKAIAEKALVDKDPAAIAVFSAFGANLGLFLAPWIKAFGADALVIGGSISQSFGLFGEAMKAAFAQHGAGATVIVSQDAEGMAIAGAASLVQREVAAPPKRKSLQAMLPKRISERESAGFSEREGAGFRERGAAGYDIYPVESLDDGRIISGYIPLARWIIYQGGARLDGYAGIDWDLVRSGLCAALRAEGARVLWYETRAWQKPEGEIDALVAPFLGEVGSVWGTKTTLTLADFFTGELHDWQPLAAGRATNLGPIGGATDRNPIIILAGVGAGLNSSTGLNSWKAPVIYFDLPKNELQYRMRAGSASNLGSTFIGPFAEMYKRSYFVDWVILNRHRRDISGKIAIVADGQHEEDPNWVPTKVLRDGMRAMATNLIRARPWFEPGVWGGQWLKQHIPALSPEEVNYAWSFELIAPENGIVFESDGLLLEIAFDWLMQWESSAILGVDASRFGQEFPIRFDFLDTFDGGNLSIQCHPSLPYIQKHFGESITQDETYYILDCKPGAGVYLGFTDDIGPTEFRQVLENSQTANQAVDIEAYVQLLPAHKHDLFLIPNRTIHGAGAGNLVLEISATPYIFTFKMYDWMRLDLDGMPRPINIDHAFHNLDFSRKGASVQAELVSKPRILEAEEGTQLELLPTHPEHFYAIHRITLTGTTRISTEGRCHLLMLVEGERVTVTTKQGRTYHLHYAETFIIPAAAEGYQLHNPHDTPIKIVKAFVK